MDTFCGGGTGMPAGVVGAGLCASSKELMDKASNGNKRGKDDLR
ncbi:MAG: hypothetical protein ACRYGF_01165 [Janthinobacterium lividum]